MENNMMSTPSRYNATMLLWNTEQDTPWLGVRVTIGWLVGCFGFNGPFRQYFSLYGAASQREGERREK